jgi:hypothetical protein
VGWKEKKELLLLVEVVCFPLTSPTCSRVSPLIGLRMASLRRPAPTTRRTASTRPPPVPLSTSLTSNSHSSLLSPPLPRSATTQRDTQEGSRNKRESGDGNIQVVVRCRYGSSFNTCLEGQKDRGEGSRRRTDPPTSPCASLCRRRTTRTPESEGFSRDRREHQLSSAARGNPPPPNPAGRRPRRATSRRVRTRRQDPPRAKRDEETGDAGHSRRGKN